MTKNCLFVSFFLLLLLACSPNESSSKIDSSSSQTTKAEYALVIHGGAGYQTEENHTPEMQEDILATLSEALDIGETILENGGSSLEAVEKTINFLENAPQFNAGKGAVFTNDEKNELDASIMQGKDHNAGAVGGVTIIKNPISAAIKVMQESEHVMMVGKGAETFAAQNGIEIVDPSYFKVQERLDRLREMKLDESKMNNNPDGKHGTVGCVALDKAGNIVAGTSTGGMSNKKFNRIGDSPIIGAGTYADNATCGVSCTGHGEYFIRYTVARDISALMEFKELTLDAAAEYMVNEKLVKEGGAGGIIAVDHLGNISMTFNTPGMYRGYAKPGDRAVKIFNN